MYKIFVTLVLFATSLTLRAQVVKQVKITELENYIKTAKQPLVVNFWATWCAPCVEELPWFQKVIKKYKNNQVQFVMVSLDGQRDFPNKINSFLTKNKFSGTQFWLNESNADYFCPKIDTTWSGAIPATLFLNNTTGYRKFLEQQLNEAEIDANISTTIKKAR